MNWLTMLVVSRIWNWLKSWLVKNEPKIEQVADKEVNQVIESVIGQVEQVNVEKKDKTKGDNK